LATEVVRVAGQGGAKLPDTVENEARAPGSPDFGMLLRHYRVAAGLSQEALAERAHMSSHGVSALERGYRRTPQRETLALLADALALSEEQQRAFETAAGRSVLLRRAGGGSVMVGPWADSGISNLPFALTSFVGREAELDAVASLMRDHRLVTLTGTGGVGKTQTALHVGTALSDGADGAAWFVGLAPIADPALVVAAIASTLGVQEAPNRPLFETLRAYLKNKTFLLILDNCEHVISEVASVAEGLLAGCPRLRILATSREPLRAAGEHTYRLPSLGVPSPEAARRLGATEAATFGAIALFVDRARAMDHSLTLTDENAPIVAEICRRLDGIPLAIELAAARVRVLSIPDLAERLDERFKILTSGSRDVLPRQKTLRALIDWSYELLAPQEQRLFARLGIFRSGFSLDAAASVCGGEGLDELDVLDVLGSLTDKSLVVADTSGEHARYRLLESTAAYALDKLSALGQREALARRHAEYFRDQALAARERFGTGSFFAWLAGIELELDNCRTALAWALTQGNDAVLGAAMASESALWVHAGLAGEGRYWVGLALERVSEGEQPRIAANLRLALSSFSSGKRKHDEGERAMRLFESVRDARGAAGAQRQVAFGLFQMRRLDHASEVLERALAASRECGHERNAAQCLDMLAFIESERGDRRAARELHAEALAAFRALGDETGTAQVLGNLAELEFSDGHPEQALPLASEALEINLRGNNAMDIAMFYTNSAAYRIALGDLTGARESARDGLRFALKTQSELNTAIGLQHLAVLAALGGDAGRAAKLLGYVDAQFSQLGYKREGTEQWSCDKLMAALREALNEDEIAKLAAEGAGWSEEQAVEEALNVPAPAAEREPARPLS
jgi:predicted ATPase/DNA-binding XRE family transcriptional regulator